MQSLQQNPDRSITVGGDYTFPEPCAIASPEPEILILEAIERGPDSLTVRVEETQLEPPSYAVR
jgi:hypothetical protein